jgi:hypothetical protein
MARQTERGDPEDHERAWCERGDSNPHGPRPRDPKSRASTGSATFAGRDVVSRVGVEPTT